MNPDGQTEKQEANPLPAPEEYNKIAREVTEKRSICKRLELMLRGKVHPLDWLEVEYKNTKIELDELEGEFQRMRRSIIEKTNAIEYYGDLVILKSDMGKSGNSVIRVETVYSGPYSLEDQLIRENPGPGVGTNRIRPRAAFKPDWHDAPANFREKMAKNFLKNFDGSFDVSQRYDQIPFTENPIVESSINSK